jgi:hypothetical protein
MDQRSASATALFDQPEHPVDLPERVRSGVSWRRLLGWGSLITRLAGAIAVLVVGVVHLQAHDGPYAAVDTIGELFIVNFVAATAIGAALLLPLERFADRWGTLAIILVSIAGIGLAGGSLVMLIIAEHGTLFGFHEPGYDPAAISRSRDSSAISVGLLTASLAMRWLARRTPRW